MVKSAGDNILISIKKRFKDEVTAPGGMVFYTNPNMDDDTKVVEYSGTVESVPEGCPAQPGDKLYFHYNVLLDTDNTKVITPEGEYYRVSLRRAFAYVRDGILKAMPGWVLVKPWEEEVKMSSIIIGADGGGLTKKVKSENKGTVMYGEGDGFAVGDRVVFNKDSSFENEFEGVGLYTIESDQIYGTW